MNIKLRMILAGCVFLITVSCLLFSQPRGPLSFQPDNLPSAQAGFSYEAKITIGGNVTPAGEFSISEGALPAGLRLEKVQGEEDSTRILGTPQQAGMFKFTVFVWCYGTNVSGQVGQKDYTLVVK